MYPNPQDVLPLPPRPGLEQYDTHAKDLVRACSSGTPDAIREWAAHWLDTLARSKGAPVSAEVRASIDRRVDQIATFACRMLTSAEHPGANCDTAFFEATCEFKGLVGRDAAADDEEHAIAAH